MSSAPSAGQTQQQQRSPRPAQQPAAASSPAGASSALASGGGGGGGLMDMVAQIAQSPAMQAMAESLADRLEPDQARAGGDARSGQPPPPPPPDFGALLQQMLPMVGQARLAPPLALQPNCASCLAFLPWDTDANMPMSLPQGS
jgi:hypothetical protein